MKNKEKTLDLDIRRNIYQFIQNRPGLHFRELCRGLEIPRSTLSYHLKFFEKRELIKKKSEEGYVRYYVKEDVRNNEKTMLHLLRQDVTRKIIKYMLSNTCASQIELSQTLDKHPTTIEFHLKKLNNKGIIEPAPIDEKGVHVNHEEQKIIKRTPIGKEIICRLKDPNSMYDSIILYEKEIVEE